MVIFLKHGQRVIGRTVGQQRTGHNAMQKQRIVAEFTRGFAKVSGKFNMPTKIFDELEQRVLSAAKKSETGKISGTFRVRWEYKDQKGRGVFREVVVTISEGVLTDAILTPSKLASLEQKPQPKPIESKRQRQKYRAVYPVQSIVSSDNWRLIARTRDYNNGMVRRVEAELNARVESGLISVNVRNKFAGQVQDWVVAEKNHGTKLSGQFFAAERTRTPNGNIAKNWILTISTDGKITIRPAI